jgi:hypothetical protein
MTPDLTSDLTTLGILAVVAWFALVAVVVYGAWKDSRRG